ncbi:hypothetical protein D3C72_1076100 [compost metagenome]
MATQATGTWALTAYGMPDGGACLNQLTSSGPSVSLGTSRKCVPAVRVWVVPLPSMNVTIAAVLPVWGRHTALRGNTSLPLEARVRKICWATTTGMNASPLPDPAVSVFGAW